MNFDFVGFYWILFDQHGLYAVATAAAAALLHLIIAFQSVSIMIYR